MKSLYLALTLCAMGCAGFAVTTFAQVRWAWQMPANAESAWIVVHLKDGGTQSFTLEKTGTVKDGGVMTRGEHEKAAADMQLQWEASAKLKGSYATTAESTAALLAYMKVLRETEPRSLATIGIVGSNGNYRPVTEADLTCPQFTAGPPAP